MRRPVLVRDLHSGHHLELFLVSAVSAVLAIRIYLRLANYPQVGGASLHIAHMLWGGLLMLVALLLLLAYLGRSSRRVAAFVGGIGFGTFIDEVGKFVTRDNDYFFRPAVALIYVTFVLTYLGMRSVRRRRVTHHEYLMNAIQEIEQAALRDLQPEERDRALQYLARAEARDPLVTGLRDLLQRAELRPAPAPSRLQRARQALAARYRELAHHPAFAKTLVAFFIAQLVVKLLHVGIVVSGAEPYAAVVSRLTLVNREVQGYSVIEWLQLGSSLVSAGFVLLGVIAIRSTLPPEQVTAALRREVAELDASVPLFAVRPLDELLAQQTVQGRFGSAVLTAFGVCALVLAAVGLYGVLAFLVSLRRREIGIRLALGATSSRVLESVIGQGTRLAALGLVVGIGGAFFATRVIESQLFGVGARDPVVFAAAAAALLAVAVVASWVPARRASRVDPQIALSVE